MHCIWDGDGTDEPSRKEASFKALSKNQLENLDDEESIFISKLERGIGKYKGNIPLKCFNYGIIGHFFSKCPYPKQEESDHEESCCHKCKTMGNKGLIKRREILFQRR